MKEFKGTQGPWTGKGMFRGVILSGEGLSLSCGFASEEAKANGKLALAAPDLLEALQTIQSKMSDFIKLANEVGINDADGFYLSAASDAEEKARAAISKALGEEL